MTPKSKTWYKEIWSLNIKNQSWTEDTKRQVDFIISALNLKGNERILDLACGFGRHSLELARRGFRVVGVDITEAYILDARKQAECENLSAVFIHADIRDIQFSEEFDVVLNMADGAIGYLENEEENLKIFDVVSRALKPGGRHFMDIMSADYADNHFPCSLWDPGEKSLTLSRFEWDRETRIMLYGQKGYTYGEIFTKPEFGPGDPIRLYGRREIEAILALRGMKVKSVYARFDGTPWTPNDIQMITVSQKK